jgi:hypothetical protein
MTTITVWLLVSLASSYHGATPVQSVAMFATEPECSRVATLVNANRTGMASAPLAMCIQTTIVK